MKESVVLEHFVVVSGYCGGLIDIVHHQRVGGAWDSQVGRKGIVTSGLHVCVCVRMCVYL